MELTINQIIEYFAHSSIQFVDVFISRLDASRTDTGRKTAPGVCGMIIPIKGSSCFSLNGTAYRMNQRTIVHAGSRMDIEIKTFENEWEYAVIHYRIIETTPAYKEMLNHHFLISIDGSAKIQQLVHYLLQQQIKPDNISKFKVQNVFMNLLEVILLSARNECYENKMDPILAALEYIQLYYAKELCVSELAQQFGMERRKFSYLFEQLTGLTPIQYITEYRIRRAKELLRTSNLPIADIAEVVGYPDSFYFSRVFKKLTKMPPSIYRKQ
ncbi:MULTISPECIES: AraC family transcriptional regulator [Bacillaceae]|uniref:helix-turn-helix domain-containing protein n=1 Tax=Bacillaceae TaxID=186817 RepID=UPI000E7641E1|nr:AraC family transcriptional regulator [Bacillus sp. PK3_68]RJS61124.1 AraC family transcriptional regulator [Bacillus sp. PK3_68]